MMKAFWLFGLFAVLAGPLLAAELTGRVTAVSDGDTLTLLVPDGASFKQVRVRLAEIDAPESGQPYGQRAKQALSDLAYNKQSRVVVADRVATAPAVMDSDRYLDLPAQYSVSGGG